MFSDVCGIETARELKKKKVDHLLLDIFCYCSLTLKDATGVSDASWSLVHVQDVSVNQHPVNKGQEAEGQPEKP